MANFPLLQSHRFVISSLWLGQSTPTQSLLRSTVTIASVIECYKHAKQTAKAIELFEQAKKEGVAMIQDVYFTIAKLCDNSKLWREKYQKLLKNPLYGDRAK